MPLKLFEFLEQFIGHFFDKINKIPLMKLEIDHVFVTFTLSLFNSGDYFPFN